MPATIDATLSGAAANSYVTLAAADTYFETVPDSSTWTSKTTDQKNRALISATRWIDALSFYGDRCTTTQALKWPREDYTVDGIDLACTLIPDASRLLPMNSPALLPTTPTPSPAALAPPASTTPWNWATSKSSTTNPAKPAASSTTSSTSTPGSRPT